MKKQLKTRLFVKHPIVIWLLPILVILFIVVLLLSHSKEEQKHPGFAPNVSGTTKIVLKEYTNKIGTVTLQYPSTWTVKEIHTVSNRAIDNQNEMNTGILSGKEGQIIVEWGPMGFGGGCKHWSTVALKNKSVPVCHVIYTNGEGDNDGSEHWDGIDNGHNDETVTEVRATAYKPLYQNGETVKAIPSSMILK